MRRIPLPRWSPPMYVGLIERFNEWAREWVDSLSVRLYRIQYGHRRVHGYDRCETCHAWRLHGKHRNMYGKPTIYCPAVAVTAREAEDAVALMEKDHNAAQAAGR